MEIIEVVDTAVKVGLGALITGVTTYVITKANHGSDRQKEAAKKKVEILTYALDKIEIYFNFINEIAGIIYGLHEQVRNGGAHSKNQLKYLQEADNRLMTATDDRLIAASRLHLIGLKDAAALLKKIASLEDEIRLTTIFKEELISMEEMDRIMEEIKCSRDKIYEKLATEFNAIYK